LLQRMKILLWLAGFMCVALDISAQSFEVSGLQESYRGVIGETIKVPLHFKNTSEKPIILVIRKVSAQLGSTQKNYFCLDNNCLDAHNDDYLLRVEPGQVINSFNIALDAGLSQGVSSIKFNAFNKFHPTDVVEFDLNFFVDEKSEKATIFMSDLMILHDVYPNPVIEHAYADYRIFNERIEAKIVIHNILGNVMEECPLPASDTKGKMKTEALNSGVYFYTLYIDNEGMITRKIILKKP
jgi:hypothetical protein